MQQPGGTCLSLLTGLLYFLNIGLQNRRQFYGVWGDTNGGTSTGEASLALGKLCFPKEGLTGNNGHDPKDVLYIGFPGSKAPGKSGANWKAKNTAEFEASIKAIGDKLVAGLPA